MSGSGNFPGLTPGAQRTVARCRRLASAAGHTDSWAAFLVLTLLLDESLASACLVRLGITREWLMTGTLGADVARSAAQYGQQENPFAIAGSGHSDDPAVHDEVYELGGDCRGSIPSLDALSDPMDFIRVLDRATEISRRGLSDSGISSANLLLAIVETDETIREQLALTGATLQKIQGELYPDRATFDGPLPVEDELRLFGSQRHDSVSVPDLRRSAGTLPQTAPAAHASIVWRVLDANLNRAREGLRVLEDFSRFVANEEQTSHELKSLRHELVAAEMLLFREGNSGGAHPGGSESSRLSYRDTEGDVGTSQTTTAERSRRSLEDVVIANCRRVQESLRSLEEFGKLVSPEFSGRVKQLRYRCYTVEKNINSIVTANSADPAMGVAVGFVPQSLNARLFRLNDASVYVLITESMCRRPWKEVVSESLAGGADVLQVREKLVNDRELVRRCEWVRDACRESGALFIVNDRPDVAAATHADGVHVGQDELTVSQARSVLQPGQLVGVSTHDAAQALQAIEDGADYLGVGPVFPSQTKSFDSFPGLQFVREAALSIQKPWFSIGGVTPENLHILLQAGASRVAVTSAVAGSDHPGDVVRAMQQCLRMGGPGMSGPGRSPNSDAGSGVSAE